MIFQLICLFLTTFSLVHAHPSPSRHFLRRTLVPSSISPSCQPFLVGQQESGGSVCLSISDQKDAVIVTYPNLPGYTYSDVHVYIGAEPPTSTAPGQFPFTLGNGYCTLINNNAEATCTIPFSAFSDSTDVCNDSFYLVTHAALNGESSETGVGKGDLCTSLVGTSPPDCQPWHAQYSTFTVICTQPPSPSPVCTKSETGYGYISDHVTTFIDLQIGKNWGWELNFLLSELPLSGTIYAGAGKNDISKATIAGTVTVQLVNSELRVSYNLKPGFDLSATHVYIGTTHLATTAPGQFGFTHDFLSGTADVSDSFTFTSTSLDSNKLVMSYLTDPSQRVYLALHAALNVPC